MTSFAVAQNTAKKRSEGIEFKMKIRIDLRKFLLLGVCLFPIHWILEEDDLAGTGLAAPD